MFESLRVCVSPVTPSLALTATLILASCGVERQILPQLHAPILSEFGDVQVTWVDATGTDFVGIARPRPRRDDMTTTELGQWLSDDRSIVWIIGGRSGSFPIEDDEFIMPVYSKATEQIITIHRSDIHARDVRGGTTKRIWSNDGYLLKRAGVSINDDGTRITTTAYRLNDDSETVLGCVFTDSGQSLITVYPPLTPNFDDIACVHGSTAFTIYGGQLMMFEMAGIGWGWSHYHVTGGDWKQPPWSTADEGITIVGTGDKGPILCRYGVGKPIPKWKDPYAIWMAGEWLATGANSIPILARSAGGRTWIFADSTIRCVETESKHHIPGCRGSGTSDRGVWVIDADFVLWRGQDNNITSIRLPIKLRK